MNKSTHFSGHPIIKQLLNLIPSHIVNRTVKTFDSDRYYKTCKTQEHLVSMLYASISGVNSLRELSTVMLACEGKLSYLGLNELYNSVQFFGKSDPKMGLSHYQTSRYTAFILLVPPCYLSRSEKRRLY